MALINLLVAGLATWLSSHVLPDNARALWRQAETRRLIAALRVVEYEQRFARSGAADLVFRRDPSQSISVTERSVKEYAVYIESHHTSSDPEVRQTVAEYRGYKKNLEGDLLWYRQLVASSSPPTR